MVGPHVDDVIGMTHHLDVSVQAHWVSRTVVAVNAQSQLDLFIQQHTHFHTLLCFALEDLAESRTVQCVWFLNKCVIFIYFILFYKLIPLRGMINNN